MASPMVLLHKPRDAFEAKLAPFSIGGEGVSFSKCSSLPMPANVSLHEMKTW